MEDIGSRAELSADVAILGGGASGALLAIHLLRAASSPLRIVLLERKEKLGRGWPTAHRPGQARSAGLGDRHRALGRSHRARWSSKRVGFCAGSFADRRLMGDNRHS